jgi:biopolymer transport protein ExbD
MQSSHPQSFANEGQRRRAVISLTPLIDVVFILLVFFMLASSFLDWRAIDLGTPSDGQTKASADGALMVEIGMDGLRLAGDRITPAQLSETVSTHMAQNPDQKVIVKTAPGISYQQAIELLDRLAAAQATDLSLIRAQEQ